MIWGLASSSMAGEHRAFVAVEGQLWVRLGRNARAIAPAIIAAESPRESAALWVSLNRLRSGLAFNLARRVNALNSPVQRPMGMP